MPSKGSPIIIVSFAVQQMVTKIKSNIVTCTNVCDFDPLKDNQVLIRFVSTNDKHRKLIITCTSTTSNDYDYNKQMWVGETIQSS